MLKKVLTYSFGEILVKGMSFLALPLYSYLILPEEYGILGLINAIMAYLPLLLTFNYLYAYVHFSVDYTEEELISTFFFLGVLLNLFYFFMALILYELISSIYYIPKIYFIISVLSTGSIFIFQILQMFHRSKQMATSYILYSFLYVLTGIILNLTCLYLMEDNVMAMLCASLITAVILSILSYKKLYSYINFNLYNKNIAIKVLKFTLPLVLGLISLLILAQADKLILEQFIDKKMFGSYVYAFVIALSMGYIGSALFASYQPIFYEEMNNGENKKIVDNFWKILAFIFIGLLLTFLVINIAYFFSSKEYMIGKQVSYLIAISYAFLAFTKVLELQITYINKTSLLTFIYSTGSLVYIILLYILIPRYEMYGAAYALILSTFIISILMYNFAQRYCYMKYDKRQILAYYIFMYIMIVVIVYI